THCWGKTEQPLSVSYSCSYLAAASQDPEFPSFTPTCLNSAKTCGTSFSCTARIKSSSTVVSNLAFRASSAVARTQYSVAMPTTPTRVIPLSRNCCCSEVSSKPEYPAPFTPIPLRITTSSVPVLSGCMSSAPGVPATQWTGQGPPLVLNTL